MSRRAPAMNYALTITPHGLIMREQLPPGPAALTYIERQACGDVTLTQLSEQLQVWSLDDPDADIVNAQATRLAESFAELPAPLYGPCIFTSLHDEQGTICGMRKTDALGLIGLHDALEHDPTITTIHHRYTEKEGQLCGVEPLTAVSP